MKKSVMFGSLLAGVVAFGAVTVQADSGFESSANVSFVSDYRFRGWSQTKTSPAVQGGFDLAHDNGFYAGIWASNVSFANNMELDYYAGFATDLNDDVSVDIGYVYYDYPGSTTADDFGEVYGSVSFAGATLGVNYSDDYYLETGEYYYLYASYGVDLPGGADLSFSLGTNNFDRSTTNAVAGESAFLGAGADSYLDYSITISRSFDGIDLGLSFIDTDLSVAECADTYDCDSTIVFSISKSL